MRPKYAILTLLCGALLGLAAQAQPSTHAQPASLGNPASADAPAVRVPYRSPFEGYRPHRDITPGPWRAMNEEVARIGGWKAYAREAHEAAGTGGSPDGKTLAPVAPSPAAGGR